MINESIVDLALVDKIGMDAMEEENLPVVRKRSVYDSRVVRSHLRLLWSTGRI